MPVPRVCVLRAPGTNCDLETAHAFDRAGGRAQRLHVFELLEKPAALSQYQILCIPGGFSYGDDVGAGVILARQLRLTLRDQLQSFLEADGLILGICNGFQVLLKSGLLPGGEFTDPSSPASIDREATLTWNQNGKYTALWVRLNIGETSSVFLQDMGSLELPIAHAEGRFTVRNQNLLTDWESRGQIALRYAGDRDASSAAKQFDDMVLPFPLNPNGSIGNVAGLCDPTGRVLGLMPHPERYIDGTQHPRWTRRGALAEGEGLQLFRNAVAYFG